MLSLAVLWDTYLKQSSFLRIELISIFVYLKDRSSDSLSVIFPLGPISRWFQQPTEYIYLNSSKHAMLHYPWHLSFNFLLHCSICYPCISPRKSLYHLKHASNFSRSICCRESLLPFLSMVGLKSEGCTLRVCVNPWNLMAILLQWDFFFPAWWNAF